MRFAVSQRIQAYSGATRRCPDAGALEAGVHLPGIHFCLQLTFLWTDHLVGENRRRIGTIRDWPDVVPGLGGARHLPSFAPGREHSGLALAPGEIHVGELPHPAGLRHSRLWRGVGVAPRRLQRRVCSAVDGSVWTERSATLGGALTLFDPGI